MPLKRLKVPEDLNLDVLGVPAVRLAFGITLYMVEPFSLMASATLTAFARYREVVGNDKLRYYATDTMNQHRKVTPRALGMLSTWLAEDAPPRGTCGLEFNDAGVFNAAPRHRFEIAGDGREPFADETRMGSASIVHWSLDPSWGEERPNELFQLVRELCGLFPFRCGHAGYILEWSPYFSEKAMDFAYAKAMRYPGLDILDITSDDTTVGYDGIRGVGWLTMLDDAFVKALGGLKGLSLCESFKVERGVIVKAGTKPAIGDVNHMDYLPAYREAFRLVEPLTRDAFERAPDLGLSDDDNNRTLAFLRRLADE